MKFIIGKKIDMTQLWRDDKAVAVTRVQAGPCVVVQVKTNERDGYEALQVGYGEKKESRVKKPEAGHCGRLGRFRYLREFRAPAGELKPGDRFDVGIFSAGDVVAVQGISKGKGFQGVVKRHGFSGSKKTHGNKDQLRMSGSIGATGPQHVFKGVRMGGRMGGEKVTLSHLEVVDIDEASNLLYIKGAVPGARHSLLMIYGPGEIERLKDQAGAAAPAPDKEIGEPGQAATPAPAASRAADKES